MHHACAASTFPSDTPLCPGRFLNINDQRGMNHMTNLAVVYYLITNFVLVSMVLFLWFF